MKAADARKKDTGELTKLMSELEAELREFRFGMTGGRTKNVRRARAIRADIARLKGILSERARA